MYTNLFSVSETLNLKHHFFWKDIHQTPATNIYLHLSPLSKFFTVESKKILAVLLYQTGIKGAEHIGLKNNTAALCNGVFCIWPCFVVHVILFNKQRCQSTFFAAHHISDLNHFRHRAAPSSHV